MRQFRRIGAALAVFLVALLANLTWLQVIDADSLRGQSGNTRTLLEQYNRARGPIIIDAAPIATSSRAANDGFYQRSYTAGPLYAAVTGYYSLLYGATGIERAENGVLSGTDPRLLVDRIQQLFAGRHQAGGAVQLTVEAAAQRAAFAALGRNVGAAVALNARTGAVLALVSTPSFDPQRLAPNDPTSVRAYYQQLVSDPQQPLLNRALSRTYAAGTPFTLVTTAAALASGRFKLNSELQAPASISVGSTTVRNANGRACGSGTITLAQAWRTSCTTAFAWLGSAIGPDAIRNSAEQFGFGNQPLTQLPSVASSMAGPSELHSVIEAAVGQRDVEITVLQMAELAAAVANGGNLMNAYVVQDVRARNLAELEHATPTLHSTPLSKTAARTIATMMLGLNGRSDCSDCRIGPYAVHSLSGGQPAWITAFAGDIAVAAVIETPAHGASTASAAARRVALSTLRAVLAKS
ncbi:MAG: penicillin-binding transpeptidase domain-containing protein [Candidatus Nanopelagicales bacterium]